jgi:hypothetical protein
MVSKLKSLRRAFSIMGLALVASLVLSGVAAGSASAGIFQTCSSTGTAFKYSDAACSITGGAKLYGWKFVETTKPATITGKTEFIFESTNFLGFASFQMICASQTSESTTLGEATLSSHLLFNGPSKTNCKTDVKNVTAKVEPFGATGKPSEVNGKRAVTFTSGIGGFASVRFEGGGLSGMVMQIGGSFAGYMVNPGSSLEFTKESTSELRLGESNLTLRGSSRLETAAGEAVNVST